MKWRHNVNHIIITCKNFFLPFRREYFSPRSCLCYTSVISKRVLYQSREKLSSRTSLSPVNGKIKWLRKIVGLQYIIELFTWMNADPYLHFFFSLEWPWNTILPHQLLKVKSKIADVRCMRISIQNRNSTGHHVSISNGFYFVDVVLFDMVIEQTATQTHQYRSEPT